MTNVIITAIWYTTNVAQIIEYKGNIGKQVCPIIKNTQLAYQIGTNKPVNLVIIQTVEGQHTNIFNYH